MKIIRCLWGVPFLRGHKTRWERIKNRIDRRTSGPYRDGIKPAVYCYGKDNADLLVSLGYDELHLMSDEPYPDEEYVPDTRYKDGRQPWIYKIRAIKQAMLDYGRVIYCDWDTQIRVKDADLAFSKLESKSVAFNLIRYRVSHHLSWRNGIHQRQYV